MNPIEILVLYPQGGTDYLVNWAESKLEGVNVRTFRGPIQLLQYITAQREYPLNNESDIIVIGANVPIHTGEFPTQHELFALLRNELMFQGMLVGLYNELYPRSPELFNLEIENILDLAQEPLEWLNRILAEHQRFLQEMNENRPPSPR